MPDLVWIHNDQVIAATLTNQSNSVHKVIDSVNQPDTSDERFVDSTQTKFVIENQQENSKQLKLIVKNCSIGVQRFDCVAFNKFNKDQQNVVVTGALEPSFPIATNGTLKLLAEGTSTTIGCGAIGYPKPSIIWFKVNAIVVFVNTFMISLT